MPNMAYEDEQIMMRLMWLNVLLLLHIGRFISRQISSTYPHQTSWTAGQSLPSDDLHPYVIETGLWEIMPCNSVDLKHFRRT